MPALHFRIFVQYQDPTTHSYKGAPMPFTCPMCGNQWFFDPRFTSHFFIICCTKCEEDVQLDDLFSNNLKSV